MNFQSVRVLRVYYIRGFEKIFVGQLALKEHRIFFEYDTEFLKTGLELSPFKLPLKPGIITSEDRSFDQLFGLFYDSLPDGWGRLLLDRKLIQLGISPGQLSPLDRLRCVGTRGMGALVYEPAIDDSIPSLSYHEDLDTLADESLHIQESDDTSHFVDDLLAMNGSSGGARPKITVKRQSEDWIIKFRSSHDPHDNGPIEYAYHLMAKAAHVDVPPAQLFPSKKGPGYFGVQRFDRIDGARVHMHTLGGLLHADYRLPSLDYEAILKATTLLTRDTYEVEKQFRAAVFNVVTHNRDDHVKNFSFLMDENSIWRVSPAYDLIFSSGPGGEHCTMVMNEGKSPRLTHLLQLAEVSAIKKQNAMRIIEHVRQAASQWNTWAQEAGVTTVSRSRIQTALDNIRKTL